MYPLVQTGRGLALCERKRVPARGAAKKSLPPTPPSPGAPPGDRGEGGRERRGREGGGGGRGSGLLCPLAHRGATCENLVPATRMDPA